MGLTPDQSCRYEPALCTWYEIHTCARLRVYVQVTFPREIWCPRTARRYVIHEYLPPGRSSREIISRWYRAEEAQSRPSAANSVRCNPSVSVRTVLLTHASLIVSARQDGIVTAVSWDLKRGGWGSLRWLLVFVARMHDRKRKRRIGLYDIILFIHVCGGTSQKLSLDLS